MHVQYVVHWLRISTIPQAYEKAFTCLEKTWPLAGHLHILAPTLCLTVSECWLSWWKYLLSQLSCAFRFLLFPWSHLIKPLCMDTLLFSCCLSLRNGIEQLFLLLVFLYLSHATSHCFFLPLSLSLFCTASSSLSFFSSRPHSLLLCTISFSVVVFCTSGKAQRWVELNFEMKFQTRAHTPCVSLYFEWEGTGKKEITDVCVWNESLNKPQVIAIMVTIIIISSAARVFLFFHKTFVSYLHPGG